MNGGEENVTAESLSLDSLDFAELEEETESMVTAKATATPTQQHVQKESVFVRLANRIKVRQVLMNWLHQCVTQKSLILIYKRCICLTV